MLFLDENNFRSKYIFPIDYHVFVLKYRFSHPNIEQYNIY